MTDRCSYTEICSHYVPDDCDSDNYWAKCNVYRMFEGILDKEVFESQILKRIFRDEHGHGHESNGYDTDTDHLIDRS